MIVLMGRPSVVNRRRRLCRVLVVVSLIVLVLLLETSVVGLLRVGGTVVDRMDRYIGWEVVVWRMVRCIVVALGVVVGLNKWRRRWSRTISKELVAKGCNSLGKLASLSGSALLGLSNRFPSIPTRTCLEQAIELLGDSGSHVVKLICNVVLLVGDGRLRIL